jgi:hypothetical protein
MRIAISTTSLVAITGAIAETVVSSQQIIATVAEWTNDHTENLALESTQGKECVFDDTLTQLQPPVANGGESGEETATTEVDAGILRCGGTNAVCVKDATSAMGGRCMVLVITNGGYSLHRGRRQLTTGTDTAEPTETPSAAPSAVPCAFPQHVHSIVESVYC